MRTALASEDLVYSRMETPIGGLLLVGRRGQLTGLFVTDHDHSPELRSHCGQITPRKFRVVGGDPHRFDSDHDGVGCES